VISRGLRVEYKYGTLEVAGARTSKLTQMEGKDAGNEMERRCYIARSTFSPTRLDLSVEWRSYSQDLGSRGVH